MGMEVATGEAESRAITAYPIMGMEVATGEAESRAITAYLESRLAFLERLSKSRPLATFGGDRS